ncbi:hypothetical protein AJ79_10315 [Helicocarpus griseus UAMH5409]|uniref:Uncharacterized protein n=1 Tax=Helicocarpus griseus UAMH5409 TaxID=1447875 RepID=A0A2B7WEW5_9EURO|nr:hypothetical protein AJ79_10315 [Helicocarpus griseus UAMH5409]
MEKGGKNQDFYIQIDAKSERNQPLLPGKSADFNPKRICIFRVYLFAISILALASVTALVATTVPKFRPSKYPSSSLSYTTSLRTLPSTELLQPHTSHGVNCGNSPAEARKLGCRFDMITFSWQHTECWNEDFYLHFVARYNNIWYWETPEGVPVPVEEVKAGLHEVLNTNWEFYIVHCLYTMEKMTHGSSWSSLGAKQRQLLNAWSPQYVHAKQCMLDLMDREKYAGKTMMTGTRMWYPACETR